MPALSSMTGFARSEGSAVGMSWAWELRSVNGRGLELRFRLPSGFDGLEAGLKELAAKSLKRGNVNANLAVKRDEAPRLVADAVALGQVLKLALDVAAQIPGAAPPRAEALLALPGVLRSAAVEQDEAVEAGQNAAIQAGFVAALAGLRRVRQGEGARLGLVLGGQLDEIAALCVRAAGEAAGQPAMQRARMLEVVRGLLAEVPGLPEERIAQEVAILAGRSDVREEMDRLDAHLHAARGLLAEGENVGRRLDFLVQEFNREANTLCSKSASVALTATGLKLKATIEQLREQVQNIE